MSFGYCEIIKSSIAALLIALLCTGCGSEAENKANVSPSNETGAASRPDTNHGDSTAANTTNIPTSSSATLAYLEGLQEIQSEYDLFRVPQVYAKPTPIRINENKIRAIKALATSGVDAEVVQLTNDSLQNIEAFYEECQKFSESLTLEDIWRFAEPDPLATEPDPTAQRGADLFRLAALEGQTKQAENRLAEGWSTLLASLPQRYPDEAGLIQFADDPELCSPIPRISQPQFQEDPTIPGGTPENAFDLGVLRETPRVIRVEPHTKEWMYFYKFEWRPDVNRFSFQPALRFNARFFSKTVPRDIQFDLIRPAPGSGKLVSVTNRVLQPNKTLQTDLRDRQLAKETFYLRVWSMRDPPLTVEEARAQAEPTGVTLAIWQSEGTRTEITEELQETVLASRQPDFSTSPNPEQNNTTAEHLIAQNERAELREQQLSGLLKALEPRGLYTLTVDGMAGELEVEIGPVSARSGHQMVLKNPGSRHSRTIPGTISWDDQSDGFVLDLVTPSGIGAGRPPAGAGPLFVLIQRETERTIRLHLDGEELVGSDNEGWEYRLNLKE